MSDNFENNLLHAFKKEIEKRLVEESIPRLIKCLDQLSLDEVWFRPNANTVSVGNLCLHLCGNVRQWLISGLGGKPDIRNRPLEFSTTGPIPKETLIKDLNKLSQEILNTLEGIKVEDLLKKRPVQIYEETGLSILVHVTEHFSYHVGQVTYFVKSRKDIDMQYYPDVV